MIARSSFSFKNPSLLPLLDICFVLACFFPNFGFAFLIKTDNQPLAPLFAIVSLLVAPASKHFSQSARYMSMLLAFCFILSCFASFFPCSVTLDERLRATITYFCVLAVFLRASLIALSSSSIVLLPRLFTVLFFLGCFLNLVSFNTSFFVNRNVFSFSSIRGLVSFYSEQSLIPSSLICFAIFAYILNRSLLRSILLASISLLSGAGQIILSLFTLSLALIPVFFIKTYNILRTLSISKKVLASVFLFIFVSVAVIFSLYYMDFLFLGRISTILRLFLDHRSLTMLDDSAPFKVAGTYFSFTIPFYYPLDLCTAKSTSFSYSYQEIVSSWISFSKSLFSYSGYGYRLYSILGSIMVDFAFLGFLIVSFFYLFLLRSPLFLYVRNISHSFVSPTLLVSLVFATGFFPSGLAFWPFWFLLGFAYNVNFYRVVRSDLISS